MPNDVEIRLNIRGGRQQAHAAMQRLLRRVARETAQGAEPNAPRRSGFLASTVGAVGPGERGVEATTQPTAHELKEAAALPSAGPLEAYAYVAATYALFVELKHPFLFPAAQAALADLARLYAEEGL